MPRGHLGLRFRRIHPARTRGHKLLYRRLVIAEPDRRMPQFRHDELSLESPEDFSGGVCAPAVVAEDVDALAIEIGRPGLSSGHAESRSAERLADQEIV